MTTTGNITAYFRIIAVRKAGTGDAHGDITISDPSWETLHATRHLVAETEGVDPMRVDVYNVKGRTGEYLGGFNAYDGCDRCKWNGSRY